MAQEDLKTYHGSCHCGNFAFTVTAPEIKIGRECNCSLCFRKGYLWIKVDLAQFQVDEGAGTLTTYNAEGGSRNHLFCATCGSGVMASTNGKNAVAVNLNTLKDFDTKALEIAPVDGLAFGEPYKTFDVATEALDALDVPEDYKTYTGHCHCGAVKIAFKSPDLHQPSTPVVSDSCSICSIHSYILAYPERDHSVITGIENTTAYYMGDKWVAHRFCKTCGTPVYLDTRQGPSPHVLETLPEVAKAKLSAYPTNLRVINGLNWKELGIIKTG